MRWALAGLGLAVLATCGAEGLEAPPPPPAPVCAPLGRGPEALLETLSSSSFEPVRRLVREHLLAEPASGGAPPILQLLRGVFGALSAFAQLPPELGAPEGDFCAASPPPLSQAHPLCEVRRLYGEGSLFEGVQVGRAGGAWVVRVLDYLSGTSVPPEEGRAATRALAATCAQTAVCRLSDGLDLVIGLAAYLRTSDGERLLGAVEDLLEAPEFHGYLSDADQPLGGEEGAVVLSRTLVAWVQAQPEVRSLDSLPLEQLPADLRERLVHVLAEVTALLDPRRDPNVLRPLQAWLRCGTTQDPDASVVRMAYRLGVEGGGGVSPGGIAENLKGLRASDPRRSALFLLEVMATALRRDEATVDALAQTCRTLLVGPAAERALPAVTRLVKDGVLEQTTCVAQAFFAGCTDGAQEAGPPACLQRQ